MKWQKHNQKIEKKIALKSISRLPVTITISKYINWMLYVQNILSMIKITIFD